MKTKKKRLSESVKKNKAVKKPNPFELHVNRKKYDVLGRTVKSEKGRPLVSRERSIKKRKVTLLQEYRTKNKSNMFIDKRIGERNRAMTEEDRIAARFAMEKMKRHKKQMYNLDDDEVLTHKGSVLNEIEKYDNPLTDDDDDDQDNRESKGHLTGNFVEDAHFGGGLFEPISESSKKSRKDVIQELIAESKKRKAEKQETKDKIVKLTEKLDTDWKDLLPVVSAAHKGPTIEEVTKPDPYDVIVKQLKFQPRGMPTEKLKSEEAAAEEQRLKLEKLIAERQRRMFGSAEETGKREIRPRSADDLDDDYQVEEPNEEDADDPDDDHDDELKPGNSVKKDDKFENDSNKTEDDVSEEENDGGEHKEESEEDGNEDESDSDSADFENNLSDLKYDSNSEEDDTASQSKDTNKSDKNDNEDKKKSSVEANLKIIQKSKKQGPPEKLPSSFEVPSTSDEFDALVRKYSVFNQAVIVERMIKDNHPSNKGDQGQAIGRVFAFILQYLNDEADSKNCFKVLEYMAPHLYDICQIISHAAKNCVKEILTEKHEELKRNPREFPGLDVIILLKTISLLFPTSDFRHPVVTPSIIFMEQILWQCRISSRRDICIGLFICTLLLEYTVLSKRLSTAAMNFLRNILCLAIPNDIKKSDKSLLVYKIKRQSADIMQLPRDSQESSQIKQEKRMGCKYFSDNSSEPCEQFCISVLSLTLKLLQDFVSQLANLANNSIVFGSFLKVLDLLQGSSFPSFIKDSLSHVKVAISDTAQKKLDRLIGEKKKPKALRLYEPAVEEVYVFKKHKNMGEKKQEREKLLHNYKRELKGALGEIRKDRTFLAKVKLKEIMRDDYERKQKVIEIFGTAANQQGELNKLKRSNELQKHKRKRM